MKDLEKRKQIMQRSIRLGHCICDPRKSCPCSLFKEKDICRCAGEREEHPGGKARLTKLVEHAGCASKISRKDLKKVLAELPDVSHPQLIVGANTCDDAGVFKLTEDLALVQTVDVFMPGVDDPYVFGQIAAANSLSDVYAMGGRPVTALSIIGFPVEDLDLGVMTEMLRGGMDKMREAGVVIAGGHSINDSSPKFGFAVTGVIDPSRIVTNANARPGDLLVLTKPIGAGVISFAQQMGRASAGSVDAAARSMTALNKAACEVMLEAGVDAATDVTGFGLLGHLAEMACQSGVSAEVYADKIPVFEGVLDYLSRGMISGGIERNMESTSMCVSIAEGMEEEIVHALYDPQTSGGMLIAVPEDRACRMLEMLEGRGVSCAAVIGRVLADSGRRIHVIKSTAQTEETTMADDRSACCSGGQEEQSECCSSGPAGGTEAKQRFAAFMGKAFSGGAVPENVKELIAVALSVLSKCEPCIKIHLEKAAGMGISQAEIDEAVWMAVAFGGAPVKMFYESVTGKQ